ncbi:MAG: diguanylate cyclase [Candidatus Omnitrophica bacterium]|nr:diguanylate cyclase [Candidatus Omnitrophota bacterium]
MSGLEIEKDEQIRQLQEEVCALKQKLADQGWGVQKTREGINVLYKEIEKKNKELERLNNLKSDFVSTVSHELRTPMTITSEGISLVLDEIPGEINDKQRKLLMTSKQNMQRLSEIINDLLDISKIEAGRLELRRGMVDLNKLVKDLVDSYQAVMAENDVSISLDIVDEENFVYIDGNKIIQVLNNLLNNAMKFSPTNGVIEVVVESEDDHVIVNVRDHGAGIEQKNLSKLFKKFQQLGHPTGQKVKGTGLGLAIAKALVEMHGGKIFVESTVGEGTTFSFALPRCEATRRSFERQMDHLLSESRDENQSLALVVVHLEELGGQLESCDVYDLMQVVNAILMEIRQIVTRPRDLVFLYDRSSVYVVLPETNDEGGKMVLTKIEKAMSAFRFLVSSGEARFSLQCTMSVFPDDAQNKEGLMEKALARQNVSDEKDS